MFTSGLERYMHVASRMCDANKVVTRSSNFDYADHRAGGASKLASRRGLTRPHYGTKLESSAELYMSNSG